MNSGEELGRNTVQPLTGLVSFTIGLNSGLCGRLDTTSSVIVCFTVFYPPFPSQSTFWENEMPMNTSLSQNVTENEPL